MNKAIMHLPSLYKCFSTVTFHRHEHGLVVGTPLPLDLFSGVVPMFFPEDDPAGVLIAPGISAALKARGVENSLVFARDARAMSAWAYELETQPPPWANTPGLRWLCGTQYGLSAATACWALCPETRNRLGKLTRPLVNLPSDAADFGRIVRMAEACKVDIQKVGTELEAAGHYSPGWAQLSEHWAWLLEEYQAGLEADDFQGFQRELKAALAGERL